MGQFTHLLSEIVAPEVKPDTKDSIVIDPKPKAEKEVNMGVKIPLSHRLYWTSQAKAQGKTIKSIIIAALVEEFGNPPD